jgi:hypothetical protein
MSNFLVLDVATAPHPRAEALMADLAIEAPSNYKDEVKIAAFIAAAKDARLQRAALKPNFCRLSGAAWAWAEDFAENRVQVVLLRSGAEQDEADLLAELADRMTVETVLVGYNGRAFDWPVLMRRALLLSVPFPTINLDKYRSSHVDVMSDLSSGGTIEPGSLQFNCQLFGFTDLQKSLQGADEARVYETQDWDGLEQSLRHDVTATYRLAKRMGRVSW